MEERKLLEKILGNWNTSEKAARQKYRADLELLLTNIQESRKQMMDELEELRKDNEAVSSLYHIFVGLLSCVAGCKRMLYLTVLPYAYFFVLPQVCVEGLI